MGKGEWLEQYLINNQWEGLTMNHQERATALSNYKRTLDFVLSNYKRMTETNAGEVERYRADCQEAGVSQAVIEKTYKRACLNAGGHNATTDTIRIDDRKNRESGRTITPKRQWRKILMQ